MVGLDGIGISQFEIYFNDSDFEIPGLDIIADIESLVILKRNKKKSHVSIVRYFQSQKCCFQTVRHPFTSWSTGS
jgi:hypothetical protein